MLYVWGPGCDAVAHSMASESEIVNLIEAEEEGLLDASEAQDAMKQLINSRKPSVVEDACVCASTVLHMLVIAYRV